MAAPTSGDIIIRGSSGWRRLASPADATKYLDGSGAYSTPAGSGGSVTAVTASPPLASSGGSAPNITIDGFSITPVARLALSESDLEGMPTTGIQIVAAQGADKVIIPIAVSVQLDITVAYGNNPNVLIQYAGLATNIATAIGSPGFNGTGKRFSSQLGIAYPLVYATFDPRNKGVNVTLSAALTSPGTGVGTAVVSLAYYIATFT